MERLGALLCASGALHLCTICIAAVIVSTFGIISTYPIVIAPTYSLKTTQQIINFVTPILALVFGVLFRDCLGRTNEAQTSSALQRSRLSLGSFETHVFASRESLVRLSKQLITKKSVRSTALFYTTCLLSYTTLAWVLSVIFIAELHSSEPSKNGTVMFSEAQVRLPVNLPVSSDTCVQSTGATNCYYDLSIAPLSSLLITPNFTYIAGVRYTPDYIGPRGIPYDILYHFVKQAENTTFPNIRARYCTPRLTDQSYYCRQDVNNTRIRYKYLNVFNDSGIYEITVNQGTKDELVYPRPANRDGSIATWTISGSRDSNVSMDTIISANGAGARLLAKMAWLNVTLTDDTEPLTMICTLNSSYRWSWQWFEFTNNIFREDYLANINAPLCSNDPDLTPWEYNVQNKPFINIPLAIEGAVNSVGSITGYSKLLNLDAPVYYDEVSQQNTTDSASMAKLLNMTELELYLSVIYGTIMTMYPSSQSAGVTRTPILYVSDRHFYRITVNWTVLSILAQVAACIVLACTIWQAVCWAQAVMSIETSTPERNLLNPLELMAYTADVADEIQAMMNDDRSRRLQVPKRDNVALGPIGITQG